jgi:hypothetical protein
LAGRFGYSDLKEAAPEGSLWVLYVVKQIPTSFKVGIGGCPRQLQRETAERRLSPGCSVEVYARAWEAI